MGRERGDSKEEPARRKAEVHCSLKGTWCAGVTTAAPGPRVRPVAPRTRRWRRNWCVGWQLAERCSFVTRRSMPGTRYADSAPAAPHLDESGAPAAARPWPRALRAAFDAASACPAGDWSPSPAEVARRATRGTTGCSCQRENERKPSAWRSARSETGRSDRCGGHPSQRSAGHAVELDSKANPWLSVPGRRPAVRPGLWEPQLDCGADQGRHPGRRGVPVSSPAPRVGLTAFRAAAYLPVRSSRQILSRGGTRP